FHPQYLQPFVGSLFDDPLDVGEDLPGVDDYWSDAESQGLTLNVQGGKVSDEPLEIRLLRGPLVAGRVVDGEGRPIADAEIRVRFAYYGPLTEIQVNTSGVRYEPLARTNTDGTFTLRCFPSSLEALRIGAWHEDYVGRWSDRLDMENADDLELVMREPASVEGYVVWSDGSAALGARVEVRNRRGWLCDVPVGETGAGGAFRIEGVPPAAVVVRAWAAGDRPERGKVQVSALRPGEKREGVVVTMNDQRIIRGVLRGSDGKPLGGEYLVLFPEGEDETDDVDGDWTDADGRFTFTVEKETDKELEVWLNTGGREVKLVDGLRPPIENLALTATPTPRHELTVRVLDPAGKPVPYFRAQVRRLAYYSASGEAGRDGVATIEAVGSPPFWLRIDRLRDAEREPLQHAPHGQVLERMPDGVLEVRLSDTAEFMGRISDQDDEPVPGVKLKVGERLIDVGEDGRFRFRADEPGLFEIDDAELVLPPGYRDASYVPTLHAGAFEDEIEVRGNGVTLRGRVELVGGGDVSLGDLAIDLSWPERADDGDYGLNATTQDDGTFVVYAVPDDRPVTVRVFEHTLAERGLYGLDGSVMLKPGTESVVLRVQRGGTIAGRLEGPGLAGLDFNKVRVTVMRPFGLPDLWLKSEQPTTAKPAFRLDGLAPGRHTVVLLHKSTFRVLAVVDGIGVGRKDVVLRVPRLDGVIEGVLELGRFERSDPLRVTAWYQSAAETAVSAPVAKDGRFRFEGLPRGTRFTLTLNVSRSESGFNALLEDVAIGDTVRLVAKPGRTITGVARRSLPGPQVTGVIARRGWDMYIADYDDDTGRFTLAALPPGTYTLTAVRGLEPVARLAGIQAGTKDVGLVVK
ncbi:MAG: hypothetical protein QNJ90_13250, partial [Planctomycetota bacterium]|nr:hypothetical protein [Planctomycetota bacterium]